MRKDYRKALEILGGEIVGDVTKTTNE